MRSIFGSSPARLRNSNSRDAGDARRGDSRRGGGGGESTKRRSFAFMKYSPDRRSSASMKASREHARQIALQLNMNEPEAAPLPSTRKRTTKSSAQPQLSSTPPMPTFQPAFPEPSAFDDFNPFGHDGTAGNSFGAAHRAPAPVPAPPPQEDFFAQAPVPAPKPSYQRRSSTATSNRSSASSGNFPMRDNSFDNESYASSGAYDMDSLPLQSSQRDSQVRRARPGRPPRNRPSSEVSFGSSSAGISWSQQPQQHQQLPPQQQTPPLKTVGSNASSHSKSMSTFPSNSSMQSAFAGGPASTPPTKAVNMTPPISGGGAAARRRMRCQLRHGSSGASIASDTCSFDGTPPASPSSSRHRTTISSNISVGSSNGGAARNRVPTYTTSGVGHWQNSPSPSMRGGASVCSSTAESDIDLFGENENGGFTFDAFGLDATEIDREVQEAMQAIEGGGDFGGFMATRTNTNTTATSTNTSVTASKPHDTSMDDFAPQAWDSPPGSRRSTPTKDQEDDGFVDGFRISKPSPLPLISVRRESPASSERSSSLSSITDHNADHGGPRRNVFKEKAGFMSSSNRPSRPSPGQQPVKKKWVPPPGAIKMLTPPRHELPQLRPVINEQQQPLQPQPQTSEDAADNYWKDHLNELPNMLKINQTAVAQEPQQQQKTAPKQQQPPTVGLAAKKWQSANSKFSVASQPTGQPATRFVRDSSFRKTEEEEKKDDDASEGDKDNHTETTSAMTTIVSEPQASPTRSPASQVQLSRQVQMPKQQQQQSLPKFPQSHGVAPLERDNRAKRETEQQDEVDEKPLSPQEQRKKELEDLRNGNSSSGSSPSMGFKSQAALHHVHHDAKQLKPQQERVNECSDQRSSFASLRERLKSSVEHEQPKKAPLTVNAFSTPQSVFHRTQSPQSSESKSEVGVSSFTRQKMKIASLSSSASKSEVNFTSPFAKGQEHQHHQPEVNAVLNRMRGMNNINGLSSHKTAITPNTSSSTPGFMAVKLRKTPSVECFQSKSEESEEQESEPLQNVSFQQHPQHRQKEQIQYQQQREHQDQQPQSQQQPERQRNPVERAVSPRPPIERAVSPRTPGEREASPRPSPTRMSYRERRDKELRKMQEQGAPPPRGSPRYQLQQTYSPILKQSASSELKHNPSEHIELPAHLTQTPYQEDLPSRYSQASLRQLDDLAKLHEGALAAEEPAPEKMAVKAEEPAPKKLSYRERRELELAQERDAKKQLEQEQKANEQPKRDVADLIRRRIAANKTKNSNSPTSDESQQQLETSLSRDRLRQTGRSVNDELRKSSSTLSSKAPGDEIEADRQQDSDCYPRSEQQDYNAFPVNVGGEEQARTSPRPAALPHTRRTESSVPPGHPSVSPRHSQVVSDVADFAYQEQERAREVPPTASAGGLSALHAQLKQSKNMQQEEPQPRQPKPAVSAGGLSALHAQLKQLKTQQSEEDESPNNEEVNKPVVPNEPRAAPKRIQAIVEGKSNFEKLEVATTNSQSSDQHSSPTRTPKATYAMLNAFLHGRDAVEEAPTKNESEEEELPQPPGSPAKPSHVSSSAAMIVDGRPALKDDPKYARYFTMLKIGMPMDVVKHAMVRDNLDPSVMDGDHNSPGCSGIPLKDDPKYSKYFKMLKIGMPMEAVKHAMERDGLDSHIMDQDHNLPANASKGKQDNGSKEKDSHRRARLHWKPLRDIRRNSLWAKIDEDPELDNIEIDEEEFAELFQAEIQSDSQNAKKGKRSSPRKGAAVRVIDPKRANNGGIILARLKMSHDDMADVVDKIDENCMTAEQIENIIEYLPTREERKALESYMLEGGQDAAEKFDGLCECEKFMVSMMTVKHAKRKVRALLFKLQFESCLEALYQETYTVETSCDELSNSVRLRQLLGIVLTFGNRLNTAGNKGKKKKAGAFTLDSLLKLNQAKAFDKKTTFLQYIVLIVQRNNELLLRFKDDLPTVFKADKVFWDQCVSDLEEVENQLENVRRIALYQARQAAKFRRKKKKNHDGDEDEESLTDLSLSLEEEVEALRATPIGLFTLSAIKKVSFLRDRVESTKVKFNKLLEYFGEDEKQTQPHELFNIIVKFCRDFDKSTEQVMADEKKKKREERKRQNSQAAQKPKTPARRQTHSGMMLKASSMQPNASRLIQDMKRSNATGGALREATAPEDQVTPQARNPGQQVRSENIGDPSRQHGSHFVSPPQSQHAMRRSPPRPIQRRESAPVQQSHGHAAPIHSNEHIYQRTKSVPLPSQEHALNMTQQRRESTPEQHIHSHSTHTHSNEHTYQQRSRASAPLPPQEQAVNISIQSSHRQSVTVPVEQAPKRSPRRESHAQSRETTPAKRMDLHTPAAETPVVGRVEAPRGGHRPSARHESSQLGVDSHTLALDVIPPGMQDTSRFDVSYGTSHQHQIQANQAINPSASTESQTSTLRQKARMRVRIRANGATSSEDPPAFTASTRAQHEPHQQPQMHRQSSAPNVGSSPGVDHAYTRRSSLPMEGSNSVPSNSQQASSTASSTLDRNRMRSRRMLERKQRVLGRRNSPTPS